MSAIHLSKYVKDSEMLQEQDVAALGTLRCFLFLEIHSVSRTSVAFLLLIDKASVLNLQFILCLCVLF